MSWQQLVSPNDTVQDYAGMCLQFTQSVYSAPIKYVSAWESWINNPTQHTDSFPDGVSVPVFFSHYGTYGNPPHYDNWGHVVSKIGDRFLSSPGSGFGQQWFDSTDQIEQTFNARLVGWTESLNGLQIVQYSNTPILKEDNDMRIIRSDNGRVALVGEFYAYEYANQAEKEWNAGVNTKTFGETVGLTPAEFDTVIADAAIRRTQFIKAVGGSGVVPDVTTKADILEAIESNYPGDK